MSKLFIKKNYRPNISKVFERAIYERLLNFVQQDRVISDKQKGFRKGKSTIY